MRHLTIGACVLLALGFLTSTVRSAETSDGPDVVVELISPGDMPRKELRFQPKVGKTESIIMTMKMGQKISVDGNSFPSPATPAQKFTLKTAIKDVASNGDVSFEFEYANIEMVDDPENPSPLTPALMNMLKPMIGSKGSAVVSDRGFTKKSEFKFKDGLAPQLKMMIDGMVDSVGKMSSPVPEEPIGVGGKWKVVQKLTTNGMALKQIFTHELTTLTADGFEITTEIAQEAEPQEVKSPLLPPGATMNLESLSTEGKGTSAYRFTSMMPAKANSSVSSNAAMTITANGKDQNLKTETKIEIHFDNPQ